MILIITLVALHIVSAMPPPIVPVPAPTQAAHVIAPEAAPPATALLAENAALLEAAAVTRGLRSLRNPNILETDAALLERANRPGRTRRDGRMLYRQFIQDDINERNDIFERESRMNRYEQSEHHRYLAYLSDRIADRIASQHSIDIAIIKKPQRQNLQPSRNMQRAKDVAIFGGVAAASSIPVIMYQNHLEKKNKNETVRLAKPEQD